MKIELILDEGVVELFFANVETGLFAVKGTGGSMAKKFDRARLANWNATLWLSAEAEAVAEAGQRYSDPV